MFRAMECSWGLLLLPLLLAGCCGTQETRFLTWNPRPPAVEAKSYDIHDPFPDEEAGPSMYSRPRTFLQPRTDERKSFELRYLKAAYGSPQSQYSFMDPATQSAAMPYPVQPIWRTPQLADPIAASPTWLP